MGRRFSASIAIAFMLLGSDPVLAQKGSQVFDFFLQQLNNQAQIEQQRQLQREQQQHHYRQQQELNRLHQEFLGYWHACYELNDVGACDLALNYPYLAANDRPRLLRKRMSLIAAEQKQHRAREAEAERERAAIAEAERERNRELERQRAEAERTRLAREQEERHIAALRALAVATEGCRRYVIDSCEAALASLIATDQDRANLQAWRGTAIKFVADRLVCKGGTTAACDAALASPAADDNDRSLIAQWRTQASLFHRAFAAVSELSSVVLSAAYTLPGTVLALPTSTYVASAFAGTLAIALAVMAVRRRIPASATHAADNLASSRVTTRGRIALTWLRRKLHRAQVRLLTWWRSLAVTPAPAASMQVRPSNIDDPPIAVELTRDTPAAIAALELAHAYIEEMRQADTPSLDDTDTRREHLNTLALAAKQLDKAQALDPDAVLEGQDEKDIPYRYCINELKAEALLLEGLTHQTYDLKRALPALRQATTLNPNNPAAFFALGLTQAANMNKGEAVAAFELAVALDPKNISYRKQLDRAQNLTGAEIAGYKVTRAGEKIFDAGIKTANAGIFIYNVGAVAWNVFAISWNIVTFPLRLVHRIFGILGAR